MTVRAHDSIDSKGGSSKEYPIIYNGCELVQGSGNKILESGVGGLDSYAGGLGSGLSKCSGVRGGSGRR